MPSVEEHLTTEDDDQINQELLNTIKIPRNMKLLQGKLPKSQYEDDKLEELDDVNELMGGLKEGLKLSPPQSNSVTNLHHPDTNDVPDTLPTTATNKETEAIIRDIRSRHGIDSAVHEITKKKRKNPRTTPMNLELVNAKPKKYQMYRNLNSQNRKNETTDMVPRRNNYKNIHEKYMQRAKEIELQEK